jgi:MFS family permease
MLIAIKQVICSTDQIDEGEKVMNSTVGLTNTQSMRFPNIGLAWKVILGAASFFFYQFMIINMMNAMNAHLQQSLQINPKVLSIISSSYFFASLLSLIPAGILLDRYSTRKLILSAMSISILSTVLLAFATKPAVVLGARFLSGLSGAFCFISCLRLATRWFSPEKFAQVIGVVVAIGMTGGILSQSPLSYLINTAGLKYSTLTNGSIKRVLPKRSLTNLSFIWRL